MPLSYAVFIALFVICMTNLYLISTTTLIAILLSRYTNVGPDEALRLTTLEVQIPPPRPNISEGSLIKAGSDLQVP